MPTFSFKAKNLSGAEIGGLREASDRFDLASALRHEGYFLLTQREEKTLTPFFKISHLLGRVSVQEKMVFAKNLAVMIGAGVSLVKALNVLSRQTNNKTWKTAVENLEQDLKKGRTLSQAMEARPKIFSQLFRSMVKAGETSGKLEEALGLIAQQLERDYDLMRKVKSALVYPAIIVLAMVAIGALMMIYVVPTLISTFRELDVELPATTAFIIATSDFLINHWILSLAISAAVFTALFFAVRSKSGKDILSAVFLKTPLISGLVKKVNAARISRTLSSLVSSGVEIVEALEVTEEVVQNPRFKNVLARAREEIQMGNPISRVFIG